MGKEWRDCIVILIDLIDVRKLSQSGKASEIMHSFHELIAQHMLSLASISNAYAWNDSVLLLSYLDQPDVPDERVMRDADRLKRKVDKLTKSYAIAVKGQTFPPVPGNGEEVAPIPGLTFITASSWAMKNCFQIEEHLGPKYKKPWYVDHRIKSRIQTSQTFQHEKVALYPSKRARRVYVFDGYLWSE